MHQAQLNSAQAEVAAVTKQHADLAQVHAATTTRLAAANAENLELQSAAAAAAAVSDADAANADAAAAAAANAADAAAEAAVVADTNSRHLRGIIAASSRHHRGIIADLRGQLDEAHTTVVAANAATATLSDRLAKSKKHNQLTIELVIDTAQQLGSHMVGRCMLPPVFARSHGGVRRRCGVQLNNGCPCVRSASLPLATLSIENAWFLHFSI